MDFSFSDEQRSLAGLAAEILERELPVARLKELETTGADYDAELWAKLADASLLGLAVPDELGGMGMTFVDLCLLLEQIGRAVAPLPALPSLVLAGMPLARFGTSEQQRRWLGPLARGEALLSAALQDAGPADDERPATRARRNGTGFVLDGLKRLVPAAAAAQRILVPARCDDGLGLFLIDPRAEGVRLSRCLSSRREPLWDLELSGVTASGEDRLGGPEADGAAALAFSRECGAVAVCATQLGVSARALEITCDHLREREQFGAPIGTLPAVQHRAADCYIDLEAMRWTCWRAAWQLGRGQPAASEVAIAKYWAAEGGSRIAAAAQHLHGGLGVDVDYPIHRYFLWSKALELAFGGASPQLARLGRDMAQSGPREL